jgi:hypothetical protein
LRIYLFWWNPNLEILYYSIGTENIQDISIQLSEEVMEHLVKNGKKGPIVGDLKFNYMDPTRLYKSPSWSGSSQQNLLCHARGDLKDVRGGWRDPETFLHLYEVIKNNEGKGSCEMANDNANRLWILLTAIEKVVDAR